MNLITEYLEKYKGADIKRPPPHWKADIVNQIVELVGLNQKFEKFGKAEQYKKTYVFWLVMIKRSRKGWGDCMELLKKTNELPAKYTKAGYIINQLKPPKTQKLL